MTTLDSSGGFPGMTPPTEPAPLLDEPRTWPKVVGIISIVWGALNIGCIGCAVLGSFMQQSPNNQPVPAEFKMSLAQWIVIGLSAIPTILVLTGGIMLVARRRAGRPVLLTYALFSLVLTVVSAVLQYQQFQAIKAWMAANPSDELAKMMSNSGMVNFQLAMIAVGVAVSLAWPVFCLIWFGMVKTNPSEIDAGVEESVV